MKQNEIYCEVSNLFINQNLRTMIIKIGLNKNYRLYIGYITSNDDLIDKTQKYYKRKKSGAMLIQKVKYGKPQFTESKILTHLDRKLSFLYPNFNAEEYLNIIFTKINNFALTPINIDNDINDLKTQLHNSFQTHKIYRYLTIFLHVSEYILSLRKTKNLILEDLKFQEMINEYLNADVDQYEIDRKLDDIDRLILKKKILTLNELETKIKNKNYKYQIYKNHIIIETKNSIKQSVFFYVPIYTEYEDMIQHMHKELFRLGFEAMDINEMENIMCNELNMVSSYINVCSLKENYNHISLKKPTDDMFNEENDMIVYNELIIINKHLSKLLGEKLL